MECVMCCRLWAGAVRMTPVCVMPLRMTPECVMRCCLRVGGTGTGPNAAETLLRGRVAAAMEDKVLAAVGAGGDGACSPCRSRPEEW